jgi:hypothetical protein
MPNVFGQRGRNKRMRFSIHFDANSEEFNQLVQTGYLNLVGHPALPPPQAPIAPPLQPHPSIVDFPEPPMQPTNDGWENIPANPPSGIVHWPDVPLPPPPPMHSMPHVAYAASMAHFVQVPRNYKALPLEPQLDKGKQPANSPSSDSSEASSVQSKQPPVQAESNERKITFNDMHPEISKVEENKFVDPDLLKHRACSFIGK